MSSISFRDFSLNQTTITGRRKTNVTVLDARIRKRLDKETGQYTEEIENCVVDIAAAKGHPQSVKLDAKYQHDIQKIATALESGKVVTANFGEPSSLKGRCYSMLNGGRMLSGVSCSADEFNIISIEDDAEDVDMEAIDFD